MTMAAEIATMHPVAVKPTDSVLQAAKLMEKQDVGDVLVMSGDDLVGILTDRDIVVRVLADGKSPSRAKVGDLCTKEVVTVGSMDSLEEAERLMSENGVRRLPVVDTDERVVGLLSMADVINREHSDLTLSGIFRAPASNS